MENRPPFLLILLTLLLAYTPTISSLSPLISPTKSPSSSPVLPFTIDPNQLKAPNSLNIPTIKDPCSQSSLHNSTLCNSGKPFRHLVSLRLINCSDNVQISTTVLEHLSTLQELEFLNCPIPLVHFPAKLISNLRSFSCINSLNKLTGAWLGRLENLTYLTVLGVKVKARGPRIILRNMKKLRSVRISHTNLTGYLPKKWNLNITHIDLSGNHLKGKVPSSLKLLVDLEFLNLSSNKLSGEIPTSVGNLLSLRNVSFASNSLRGSIPNSISDIPGLVHLDLSSNQFNGTIPKFISEMKELKYLNLENNNFNGVLPFNGSFIKRLAVFKVGGNSNLCYNHSMISSKLKLGISRCDKDGLPVLPPPYQSESHISVSVDVACPSPAPAHEGWHWESKIILVTTVGLSCIVFALCFLVLLSKWCK
ncbi:hypothetical protein HHK36_003607 [Tetracentron sinense]|uniref:Uncharacterized protein n=1 Tax=Tetracentron sinense TaxID=13715 RepID=A0A834ZTP9_TETSI|nr:hypothetical protein HHK36_003607 [Tetracentron sinense]